MGDTENLRQKTSETLWRDEGTNSRKVKRMERMERMERNYEEGGKECNGKQNGKKKVRNWKKRIEDKIPSTEKPKCRLG